ncbi:MAG: dephospho-CoA kinase [Clostridia bacterium]|nr:dephospho-CoA kinase [Clostridia bacterium]
MSGYVVGLTGGIACGKTNLSNALRAHGVRVIDADEISRSLTARGGAALPAIRTAFGDGVFDGEALNRRALAGIVFSNEEERRKLNDILHPMILDAMRKQMAEADGPVVLDVPLLFEAGIDGWCDEIWCAYVTQKEQVKRVMHRDHVTAREALRRVRAQMPAREKARRADHVIRTDESKDHSASIVLSLWQQVVKGETHP